jgi:hypothetical protein
MAGFALSTEDDDSRAHIREPRYRQQKVKRRQGEHVEIVIEAAA